MVSAFGPLSIDDNLLKDCAGRVVVTLPKDLRQDQLSSYAHMFAASAELLHFMEDTITQSVAGLEARMKQESSSVGFRAYTGRATYPSPPAWLEKGIQSVAMAKGENVQPDAEMMMPGSSPLYIDDNILKDEAGQVIAVLSKEIGEDRVYAYAHRFAASVHLLDVMEFLSSQELGAIEQADEAAREFNKLTNTPSDVRILSAPSAIIPESLSKLLQIVAKAKGTE
jgi:hypothetical protein